VNSLLDPCRGLHQWRFLSPRDGLAVFSSRRISVAKNPSFSFQQSDLVFAFRKYFNIVSGI
jgi:hypothetical protein